MPVVMERPIKFSKARVAWIYVFCALWTAFGPLESYFRYGVVEQSQIVIALLTFLVGVVVVTITLVFLAKHNQSLKRKAESKQ
ncbi:MAG: hypothetical protein WDZ52_10880 [Pseudohongiellaceae bacterium]